EALGEAKSWLEDCLQSHADCPKPDPTFTPTRLVQISPECRLCEMGTQIEPYAALSYCWGGDQVFKTTSQMLPQYKQAIDPTRLPQTLQDAIHVARQLGLHYIWIDALCIIQNSNDDKAIEIGRMAHVYGNATITIGATRASAVWNGFLSPRSPLGTHSPHKIFSLPCKYKGQDMGTVTLLPYTGEGREALDSRGWTFQERVLSPRILDFGSLRTQFTCQTALDHVPSDGWSHLPLDRPYGDGIDARLIADLLAGLYPPEEMLQHWDAIVQGFTDRSLAFATDKFPAIAGMAERYGAILNDEYCAGLWRRGMPANLLWTVDDGLKQIYGEISPRLLQGEVSAPSWSWAAVSQPVRFEAVYTRPGKDTTFCVSVEDCEIQHVDVRAPYGGVATGTLTLR
ncbi:HET-domain-containing protein, partial [Bimuria novae-zelandiae CBS 107.79]